MTKYFNSVDAVSDYAQMYPASLFRVEPNPQRCLCNGVRCGYEVSDKQDCEILETLVVCPVCANRIINPNTVQ